MIRLRAEKMFADYDGRLASVAEKDEERVA